MAFFTQFLTVLSSFVVSWFNLVVDVPVNADLNSYLDLPYAVIEDQGQVIEADYYQNNGVNFTFVSTINTNIVKDYVLFYRAYFSDLDINSIQAVTFHVYDDIAPKITKILPYTLEAGSDPPDFNQGVFYSDNYDDQDDLILTIDDHLVNYDQIGTYQVIYTLTDSSYNQTQKQQSINIVDTISPKIVLLEPMVIERGEDTSLYDYFIVTDNYDLAPDIKIMINDLDMMICGRYMIDIYAVDQSNNQSQIRMNVSVIDTKPPIIRLQSNPQPIVVGDDQSLNELDRYVLDIYDIDTLIKTEDMIISHDIQINRLGTYHIYYVVTDDFGNTAYETLQIDVIDNIAPLITVKEPLVFPVFCEDPFIQTYVDVTDNYDDIASLIIEIKSKPVYDQVGKYPLTVTVKDTSKNISIYEGFIIVEDTISPEVIQLNEIIITDFMAHPLLSYFKASDNYDLDSDIEVFVDDDLVNYEEIGIYPIDITVTDTSSNQICITSEVFIVDIIAPVLTLAYTTLTLSIHDELPDFVSYIAFIEDNNDELMMDDVIITHDVSMQDVGIYEVEYSLKDQSGNMTKAVLFVVVDDFTAPEFTMSNITISQYETIDLLADIDVKEEDSTYYMMCFPESIDSSKPGEHIITYVVQDERGNFTTKERVITILPTEDVYDINDFIPMILVLFAGMVVIVAIKKHG